MTLTREEILAMKPGRELDMLVNQHLFGYSVRSHLAYKEGMKIDRTDFLPSTFLPNAWEVVEKMRQTHWVDISGGLKLHLVSPYTCQIGVYGVPGSLYADGETAPEAICKAALLAVLNL